MKRDTFVLALLGLLAWSGPARADLLAGVAEADVTPKVGVPLAGYGGRIAPRPDLDPRNDRVLFRGSTGVHDPIEAQALVLEQGGQVVALLCVDAIGVEYQLLRDVARAAQQRGVPLGPERLVMAASHTHHGPGALSRRWLWQVAACDLFDRDVHRPYVAALADVVVRAYRARRPARLVSVAAAVKGVSRNRRGDGVDPTLRVLRIDDEGGRPLAVVLNYALHPICRAYDDLRFSADVAGAIRRRAREKLGVPVLFTQGAAGDVSPSPGGQRGLEVVGNRLGDAVAELATDGEPRQVGLQVLHTWHHFESGGRVHPELGNEIDLPEGYETAEQILVAVASALRRLDPSVREPFVSTRFRYTAIRLGDVVLLFVPAEPIAAFGEQLRAAARATGFRDAWVIGLSNGHMGYLCTPDEYDQGGYEAWLTFYGRDTADVVQRRFEELLRRLGPL